MTNIVRQFKMTDQVLVHHGVKGMKWGVRRYRNKDGTLTAEGKAHAQKLAERDADNAKRDDYKQAMRNRRNLSDEELLQRIGRLEREARFKKLTEENLNDTAARELQASGKKAVNEVLINSGKKVAGTVLVGGTLFLGRALLTGQIEIDQFGIDADTLDKLEAIAYLFPNPNKKK